MSVPVELQGADPDVPEKKGPHKVKLPPADSNARIQCCNLIRLCSYPVRTTDSRQRCSCCNIKEHPSSPNRSAPRVCNAVPRAIWRKRFLYRAWCCGFGSCDSYTQLELHCPPQPLVGKVPSQTMRSRLMTRSWQFRTGHGGINQDGSGTLAHVGHAFKLDSALRRTSGTGTWAAHVSVSSYGTHQLPKLSLSHSLMRSLLHIEVSSYPALGWTQAAG